MTTSFPYPLTVGELQTIVADKGTYPVRAMLTSGYVYDPAHQFASDVGDEISGGSYARVDLDGVGWSVDDDVAWLVADDAAFASMTATGVDGLIVFADHGADATSPLVASIIFAPQDAAAEPVTVRFSAGKVVKYTPDPDGETDPGGGGTVPGEWTVLVDPMGDADLPGWADPTALLVDASLPLWPPLRYRNLNNGEAEVEGIAIYLDASGDPAVPPDAPSLQIVQLPAPVRPLFSPPLVALVVDTGLGFAPASAVITDGAGVIAGPAGMTGVAVIFPRLTYPTV